MQQRGSIEQQEIQIMTSHCNDPPQVTFWMFVHCQQEISCVKKLMFLKTKERLMRMSQGRGVAWHKRPESWCLILTKICLDTPAKHCNSLCLIPSPKENNPHFLEIITKSIVFLSSKVNVKIRQIPTASSVSSLPPRSAYCFHSILFPAFWTLVINFQRTQTQQTELWPAYLIHLATSLTYFHVSFGCTIWADMISHPLPNMN